MIALTNHYVVVIDACDLVPMPICDTLLRLAEEPAFYILKWSLKILEEVERTLRRWGYSPVQAKRRTNFMMNAFEDAIVSDYEPLIEIMQNHVDDRHVLAAAVKCGANAILTENTKHFPDHAVAAYGIETITADNFLIHQYHFDKDQVLTILEQQAAKIRTEVPELLTKLSVNTPKFCTLVGASL